VVLVHGFTQTAAAWDEVAGRLAGVEAMAVDAPGHGASDALRLGMGGAAAALGATGGRAVYAGYSMGGRICLRLALDRPDLVRALVLVGASPGLADPAERAARVAADEALADGIERDGVAAFLERWLATPLFATLPPGAAGLRERLANSAAGLASSLRLLGTGAQEPLWDRLPELRMPVLLVAGALDTKFTALARRMAAAIGPAARVHLVQGAGHSVPLERPAELARLILQAAGTPA
jgi:2-succinyl-6-hydroxy-2,4-cyclohexadiene-1-carboxylate synthase